jgi:predicted permease
MIHLLRDVRYGWRLLAAARGFTAVAVATLAIGIGGSTAVFSVVNAALFKPIYAERPDELVEVVAMDGAGRAFSGHSYINYLDFRHDSLTVVDGLAAVLPYSASLGSGSRVEHASIGLVSDNYFSVLGIAPLAGRSFRSDENEVPGAHFVAVISESLWRREFGASPGAVDGGRVSINNAAYTVIGVVPERASRIANVIKVDVFVPAVMQGPVRGSRHWLHERGNREFFVLGRMKAGVALAEARGRFAVIGERLRQQYPEAWGGSGNPISLTLVPATTLGLELRRVIGGPAGLLMAVVACLTLIVCANLANLLLARTSNRRREISVRLALGASRAAVVRQLLVETLLLAAAGGVFGVLLAMWARGLVNVLVPSLGVPIVVDLSLDHRVAGFSLAMVLLTTLAYGLLPALRATRAAAAADLEINRGASTVAPRNSRLRGMLIVSQVAASILLLMAAGTLVQSLGKLQRTALGFDAGRLGLLSIALGGRGFDEDSGRVFVDRMLSRLQRLPGVESVSVAARVPVSLSRVRIQVFRDGTAAPAEPVFSGFNTVGPRYFETMGIPVIRGRAFDSRDRKGSPGAAIVNERLAAILWPAADPIGQPLRMETGSAVVVGVVKNSKYENVLEDPLPHVYLPLAQSYRANLTVHVRSASPPAATLESSRREILALDPLIAVFDVQTMDAHLADSLLPVRAGAALAGVFGALALGLASIGLYGVLAYNVSQRTRELGIRLALGARPAALRRLVLGYGMRLTVAGVLIGLAAGSAFTAVVATMLYGVSPADVITLAVVVVSQTAVALIACWIPARRATRLDPVDALRHS